MCVCKYFFQQKRFLYNIKSVHTNKTNFWFKYHFVFIQNVYNNIIRLVIIHYVVLFYILLINLDFLLYSIHVKKKQIWLQHIFSILKCNLNTLTHLQIPIMYTYTELGLTYKICISFTCHFCTQKVSNIWYLRLKKMISSLNNAITISKKYIKTKKQNISNCYQLPVITIPLHI